MTQSTAVEVRYVGTLGGNQWSELNYNERNVVENGFLDEFKKAMVNLQANNAAGEPRWIVRVLRGRERHESAADLSRVSQWPVASGECRRLHWRHNTWTNTTLAGRLVQTNPNPNNVRVTSASSPRRINAAADLDNNLTRRQNAQAAGLPANFFVVNPPANLVNVTDSGAFSSYHAMQLEVRRRLTADCRRTPVISTRRGGISFLGFHSGRVSSATKQCKLGASHDQDAVGLVAADWPWRTLRREFGRVREQA